VYYENDCLTSATACSSKLYASMIAGTPVVCNTLPAFTEFSKEYGGCIFMRSLDPEEIRYCAGIMATGEYRGLRVQANRASAILQAFPRAAILKDAMRRVLGPGRLPVHHQYKGIDTI
jgi:hypothetical protein